LLRVVEGKKLNYYYYYTKWKVKMVGEKVTKEKL